VPATPTAAARAGAAEAVLLGVLAADGAEADGVAAVPATWLGGPPQAAAGTTAASTTAITSMALISLDRRADTTAES
jgi:hypothetical protein